MPKKNLKKQCIAPNLTNEHFIAQSWCFKNKIYLYVIYVGNNTYKPVMRYKGKETISDIEYDYKTISQVYWDGYLKIYKNKKN